MAYCDGRENYTFFIFFKGKMADNLARPTNLISTQHEFSISVQRITLTENCKRPFLYPTLSLDNKLKYIS